MESNKTKAIELQEKANNLRELAEQMDSRIKFLKEDASSEYFNLTSQVFKDKRNNTIDTCERGSKRLWSAYLQVLTQIKLEL
jgi:hypothetical protein